MTMEENQNSQADKIVVVKPLTHKQLKFAETYLRTGVLAQACREAGYNERSGWAVLKSPTLLSYLRSRQMQELSAEARDKKALLSEIAELKKKARTDGKMNLELRALELDAKILGLVQHDKKPTTTINQEFTLSFGDAPIPIPSNDGKNSNVSNVDFTDLGNELKGLMSGFTGEDSDQEEED